MAFDIVIRNGTVVDGTGLAPLPRRRRHRRRPHRAGSAASGSGARPTSTPTATSSRPASSTPTPTWTRRCSGTSSAPTRAGTASRRWSWATAASRSRPRRDDAARRSSCATSSGPRTSSPAALAAGHRVDVGRLRRVPRRGRPAAEGHQLRRQHRPLGRCAPTSWASGPSRSRPPTTTWPRCVPSSSTRCGPGAFGFTTSRTMHHQTSDDRPVASRLAAWSEVDALVRDVGTSGGRARPVRRGRRAERRSRGATPTSSIALSADTGVTFMIGGDCGADRR